MYNGSSIKNDGITRERGALGQGKVWNDERGRDPPVEVKRLFIVWALFSSSSTLCTRPNCFATRCMTLSCSTAGMVGRPGPPFTPPPLHIDQFSRQTVG